VPESSSTPTSPFKGTYALVLRSDTSVSAEIGRWGRLAICRGYYLQVGSALGPGGVRARVSRHCRGAKSKHWHIPLHFSQQSRQGFNPLMGHLRNLHDTSLTWR
jgi:Uri superfamily endonuclease